MIIWIVSYPRSGNTFLRVVLNSVFKIKTYSIYDDRIGIGADEKTSDIVGHQFLPDDFVLSQARKEEKCFFIKTHELPDERIDKSDKIIYLIRDGRESVFSYKRYLRNIANEACSSEDIIYGSAFSGGWGEHVQSWHPGSRNNTLLIKFEELINAPERLVAIISEFISVKSSASEIPGFEELNQINPKFFNSGKKDSWKNEFTDDEHIAFWMKNHTQMLEYGYLEGMPEVFEDKPVLSLFKQLSLENTYQLKKLNEAIKFIDEKCNQYELTLNELKNRDQLIAKQQEELRLIKSRFIYKLVSVFTRFSGKLSR